MARFARTSPRASAARSSFVTSERCASRSPTFPTSFPAVRCASCRPSSRPPRRRPASRRSSAASSRRLSWPALCWWSPAAWAWPRRRRRRCSPARPALRRRPRTCRTTRAPRGSPPARRPRPRTPTVPARPRVPEATRGSPSAGRRRIHGAAGWRRFGSRGLRSDPVSTDAVAGLHDRRRGDLIATPSGWPSCPLRGPQPALLALTLRQPSSPPRSPSRAARR